MSFAEQLESIRTQSTAKMSFAEQLENIRAQSLRRQEILLEQSAKITDCVACELVQGKYDAIKEFLKEKMEKSPKSIKITVELAETVPECNTLLRMLSQDGIVNIKIQTKEKKGRFYYVGIISRPFNKSPV